ncbi:MAG TPA: hypothetical protein VMU84_14500 [Thermoanaerobaculia bacterium]|nr:hypothetical protein [Thermoanaerobaculia bacterium]
MADNTDKGFWRGGASGHSTNRESSGRPSGFPGSRKQKKTGVRTDIDSAPKKPVTKP